MSRARGGRPGALLGILIAFCAGGCAKPSEFTRLWDAHCAGCHGANGWDGPAAPLANPVYLAWVDDDTLRRVIADGVPGHMMPAFARRAGGPLDDAEIALLVDGMRRRWAKPVEGAERLPPYSVTPPAGLGYANDVASGAGVYVGRCQSCHEPEAMFRVQAGSPRDPDYLALVSDQALRTAVVAGRPDLGMPDWRGERPDWELTPKQVSEVVLYLSFQRRQGRR